MDISSIGGSAMTSEAQALYSVACMKMARSAETSALNLIFDSVEISAEAMEKYLAEKSS